MGNELPPSGEEILDVYGLMAALAGEGYSRADSIKYMNFLIRMTYSPYIATETKRAIGFVERVTLSFSNLSSAQLSDVVEKIQERRRRLDDGF